MFDLTAAWQREAARLAPTSLTLEAMDWSRPPDPARSWVPEKLTPLAGCTGYTALTPAQRLAYNQAYACQLLEEFIWIESRLVLAPLDRLKADDHARPVLASFRSDEEHHIACFKQLRALAGAARENYFRPPILINALARLAAFTPHTFTFWIVALVAFEDYAIDVAKLYRADDSLEPLFRNVFIAHARDEARHCRFDTLLESWLGVNPFNARLHAAFKGAYYATSWGLDGPVMALARRFQELASRARDLHAEAHAARADAGHLS